MVDIEERVRRAIEEIAGNEALLEMLETEAADEMLEWGKTWAISIVNQTEGMDEAEAEQIAPPRLKAVRQTMRSVGNWAVGKYADPESRVQLRDNLLKYFRVIFGEEADLPNADELDALIHEVDDPQNNPQQLILKMKTLLNELNTGDSHHVSKA
ncbi:MAG TPA: hypothetical protein VK909_15625 [Anaerolineales bacterium]|jgi:hypothetical protein|nr:hypothetical protein [Anaerolineales bacterium]